MAQLKLEDMIHNFYMKILQKDYEIYILIIILVWDLMINLTNSMTRKYSVFFFLS